MPYGIGAWGWFLNPYEYSYWGRCRRFPWIPRWWWTGIYGSMTPYSGMPPVPKEDEIAMLEDEAEMLEQELERIKKRLEELRK
ncbi:MAG: DUF5320 domain-containing protein [Candidatus Methylarchaceae archaeon HK02M1]|nr:DUF5320 domain-containing protein [Candidatus Methylarchaceae archaeon HK01M]MCP8312722.1 DUF5320 domain-containing protein [Candidatus Methylarchaceae archaeon HK02M1]